MNLKEARESRIQVIKVYSLKADDFVHPTSASPIGGLVFKVERCKRCDNPTYKVYFVQRETPAIMDGANYVNVTRGITDDEA